LHNGCLKVWTDYYFYLHPLPGADEVSGELWQLATAIYDEGDGLILSE
jgi:hypothetical protein